MFIKTQSGTIVNLDLVGEIEVKYRDYKDVWDVIATTGSGGDGDYAVYAILFRGTEEQCNEYIDSLWSRLELAEVTLGNK